MIPVSVDSIRVVSGVSVGSIQSVSVSVPVGAVGEGVGVAAVGVGGVVQSSVRVVQGVSHGLGFGVSSFLRGLLHGGGHMVL